jgi:Zn-dependent protease with chaperone function
VTATVVTGLIVIHALIPTVILVAGVKAIAPGMALVFGGAILAGALAGVRAVPRALFGAVRETHVSAFGARVPREQAPELWRLVETTATRLRALPPDEIVAGLDDNFFVTEARVETPNGPCHRRTLFCSLPLARILTVDEFMAAVAHELGHFRGDDTVFSRRFSPIYGGTAAAIQELAESGEGGRGRRIALLPAIAIFEFFLERFAVAERRHARERELIADRASVEATSARTAATALVKCHACAPLWREALEQAASTPVGDGECLPNVSALFASAAASADGPALLEGILETHTAHPTDTHPTLAVRLDALGVDLAAVAADALQLQPREPAATLVPDGVLHEEALSEIAVLSRDAHR